MEPSMRGALRSETKATALALRGETETTAAHAHGRDEEQGERTPPPSPSSAAALAASFGADDDDDYVDEDAGDDSAFSEDDEDNEKATSRKRRTKLSTKGRKRLRRGDQSRAVESEDVTSGREDVKFQVDRRSGRSQQQQNWVDDGCAATFESRLAAFRRNVERSVAEGTESFYHKPRPTPVDDRVDDGGFHDEADDAQEDEEDAVTYEPQDVLVTDSGLSVPTYIHAHMYPHQKECLEWLHHLHERNTGGILGDDMGLGKTVQIAAFLGAMHHARRLRTVLLLCPASVLLQWVREFHTWYPPLRVVLLHSSGTGVTRANRSYAELIDEVTRSSDGEDSGRGGGGVLVTTYENVRQYQELFVDVEWDYVVLDEGHRIRNPDAEITLVCKQLKTVHRVLLTGTPIQNRLRELWSLFDFVYPGKLGTLPTFEDEFVLPIRTGGYANASKMQVVMAYKCALALRDVIAPFLLRRTKKEIQHVTKMPEKMEQILFCTLTRRQYETYEAFLASAEVAAVLRQDVRPFRAISILRHICNHPDLLSTMEDAPSHRSSGGGAWGRDRFAPPARDADELYGAEHASGKMLVLQKILRLWKQQGHRVLLFTQTRKMLDILESFMAREGHLYCRLDGTTSVRERQSLLDAFNRAHSEIFVFLLTTRAGGIGVNLTGADRVVIFDPDWNPSTDLQARERSWRLGQTRAVTIYRLITSGTIEEKIYHRQIFKQYLTSKVLHDAKRKRCFNKHTLRDLFVLTDQRADSSVETTEILVEGNVARPSPSRHDAVDGPDRSIDDDQEGDDQEKDASAASASVDDADVDDDDGGDGDARSPGAESSAGAGAGDNDAILKHLFDGDQIKGVFNHDVVEADGVQNQEADLIEMESTKIAESALSALRASCALIRQQRETEYTPTWTGRSGTAGDPSQRSRRFGGRVARGRPGTSVVNVRRSEPPRDPFAQRAVSSREMLARIKGRRNGVQAAASGTPTVSHIQSNGFMSVDQMTKQLHAFLLTRCGATAGSMSGSRGAQGVTTEELLDVFASVVAPKDKLVFRNLLRDMAVCRGRRWVLKPEYMTGGS